MMKKTVCLVLLLWVFSATAETVSYQLNGQNYEGFYTSAKDNAPLIVLLHDWDGLTEYEIPVSYTHLTLPTKRIV